jgi:hypothetical protein
MKLINETIFDPGSSAPPETSVTAGEESIPSQLIILNAFACLHFTTSSPASLAGPVHASEKPAEMPSQPDE